MEEERYRTIQPFDVRTVSLTAYDDLLEGLGRLEELLNKHDICIRPSSRIDKYRRAISDFREVALRTSREASWDWRVIHQAAYEIEVITDAVHELSRPAEVSGWKGRIAKLLSGPSLPQHERPDKSPWPFQYEIQLAAVSRRAGYDVCFEEPDVVVTHPDLTFGIAAKRPLSQKKISENLRDGAKQIVRAGHEGIVALDLTALHNPQNVLLSATNVSAALLNLEAITNHFLNQNSNLIRASIREARVFGVLVSLWALYLDSKPRLASATRWAVMNLCTLSDSRCQVLTDFVRKLGEAIGTKEV